MRPFRVEDETAALSAHAAMLDDELPFLLDYTEQEPWAGYVARRETHRSGDGLPTGSWWVPNTFLAATVDGALVGRASIRHELNDWLAKFGGHVGYAVLPSQRRRGYATEILRQSLVIARSVGVEDVLLLCHDGNAGSARTIEACGGRLESTISSPVSGERFRRYWIS